MTVVSAALVAFIMVLLAGVSLVFLVLPDDKRQQRVQKRWQQFNSREESVDLKGSELWIRIKQSPLADYLKQRSDYWRTRLRGLALENEDRFERLFYLQIMAVAVISFILMASLETWLRFVLTLALSAGFVYWRWSALNKRLMRHYEEQLPHVVDHIRRAVSSGLSVPQAIRSSAEQTKVPTSTELQRISQQLQMGISLNDAIAESKVRIPIKEFHFLGMILVLNQKTGGRLADALENLSEGMRERKAMKQKLASMTSEPRSTALIVSLFPPLAALGLFFFSPAQVEFLLHDDTGQAISMYVIGSVIFGLFTVHRMARGGIA